ncbi:MAG TPA: hypothetical protein VG474_01840 [Solirubrobacteraceae bacterium]|nr:hypothetical protein [Solirubrobacteraceae bacterium]
MRRAGSWSTWSVARRRLVVLTVGNWLAGAVLAAIGIVLGDARVVALGFPLLAVDWWLSGKLREAEYAEGALVDIIDAPPTREERELLDRLDAAGSDRDATKLLARRWLAGDTALRRYEYPTRELLVLRSVCEAVEVTGLSIVMLAAPNVAAVALGGMLWLLGGRAGTSVAKAALGERLYHTPIDDATRERWLRLEGWVITVVAVPVVALALIRYLG